MSDFFLAPDPPEEKSSLRDRIARVTREGGFERSLPPTYDAPGEDWKSVCSHDPFERLFLDWRQAGSISEQTVRKHGILIARFWEGKARQVESGAGAWNTIAQTYGDRARLRAYERQAHDDAEALATPEKRMAAAEARLDAIRTQVLARFEDFVLGDHTLSPEESGRLLSQAEAEGWTREAAAAFLLAELDRRGFRNGSGAQPDAGNGRAGETLLSSAWRPGSQIQELRPENVIGQSLATALQSGSLEAAQIRTLLDAAVEAGIGREAAAEFIAARLGVFENGWRPAPGEVSVEGSLADALASVRWLSPARYSEALRNITEERRRNLETAIAQALEGGALTVSSAKNLLAASLLDQEEAAQIMLNELKRRGFQPGHGRAPSGDTPLTRLLSANWTVLPALKTEIRHTAPSRWLLAGGLGVAVLAAVFLFARAGDGEEVPLPPIAIINTPRLNVRSSPTNLDDRGIIGQAGQNDQLRVTAYTVDAEGERWLRVDFEGQEGWVSDQYAQFTQYHAVPRVEPGSTDPPNGGEIVEVIPPPEITPARLIDPAPTLTTPPGGFEGTAQIRIYLDPSGRVEGAECLSVLPDDLCRRAENTVARLRFEAEKRAGQPVRSSLDTEVRFTPKTQPPPPSCPEAEIKELVDDLLEKSRECAGLADPAARQRCLEQRDAINAELKRCSE